MTPRTGSATSPTLIPVPTLDQVAGDPSLVASLPRETAVALYSRAAVAEATLRARLLADPGVPVPLPPPEREEWLSASEVEARFSLPKRWLVDHAADLRQARIVSKASRKRVVYHRARLARFLEARCEP